MTLVRRAPLLLLASVALAPIPPACRRATPAASVTVPVALDHNRMLVEADVQRRDGSWRRALLWIDTGNPDFIATESFARDLGIDVSAGAQPGAAGSGARAPDVRPPGGVRIGGMALDFSGIRSGSVLRAPLFLTMHADANLPSTVLRRYRIVFDYPRLQLTIAEPGSIRPRGERAAAEVDTATGIVQIDALVGGDTLSFALDNGASYSYVSADLLARLSSGHPDWPRTAGALGCANIWGLWPGEHSWPVVRVPEITWGPVHLRGVGLVGLPNFFGGMDVGAWYSQKAARPVAGFLGPNAFKGFRVEIDYANGAVYFEGSSQPDARDMDLVGLTLQPQPDSSYVVIGVASRDGRPSAAGVEPGDVLVRVGDLTVKGATMGSVVDALRGAPGDVRNLELTRNGRRISVAATVRRFL